MCMCARARASVRVCVCACVRVCPCQVDTDGSGEIDFDEFCALISKNLKGAEHLKDEILQACQNFHLLFLKSHCPRIFNVGPIESDTFENDTFEKFQYEKFQ